MSSAQDMESQEPAIFGVNVAKVREVIRLPSLEPSLSRRPEVLGLFQLRGRPVPVIHLAGALGLPRETIDHTAQVLVTEFSGRLTGFVVAAARRIRRVSWSEVLPPQRDLLEGITGLMLDEQKRFIFILDFEKVLAEIEGFEHATPSKHFSGGNLQEANKGGLSALWSSRTFEQEKPIILLVDDSATARKALLDIVARFECSIVECVDGEQAWQESLKLADQGKPFMVISDIEMPRLDGYSFARRMKSNQKLAGIPFLLHSSLSGEANRERAMASGADAFIGKFNTRDIVAAVEICLEAIVDQQRKAS